MRRAVKGIILFLFVLIVDQFSKFLIFYYMESGEVISVPPVGDYFKLRFIKNPGAAFGILPYRTELLIFINILLIVLILFYWRNVSINSKNHSIDIYGFSFIVGGAVGNLIDRLYYGAVIDFLDFQIWPVFNFADIFIFFGLILVVYDFYRKNRYQNF